MWRKWGNIVPRAGIKPTSLAFQASVLPLFHIGSLISPLYPNLPVYAAPCLRGQCRILHLSPWNCKSFNAYNYIHTSNGLTQSRINNHTAHRSWSWQPVSRVWQKWEILCLEWELDQHLWHSRPHRLHDVTTIPTPTCLCSSLPHNSVQTTAVANAMVHLVDCKIVMFESILLKCVDYIAACQ